MGHKFATALPGAFRVSMSVAIAAAPALVSASELTAYAGPGQAAGSLQQTSLVESPGTLPLQALAAQGKSLYARSCQACHGQNLVSAGMFPDLRRFSGNEADFLGAVKFGRPQTAMPSWGKVFNEAEIKSIWAYVQSAGKAD